MVMIFGSPSVTAKSTATRSADIACALSVALPGPLSDPLGFRGAATTSSVLAISEHAAGVRQARPVRPVLRAAVIGAVIAVGMIGAVIAGQRPRSRQPRRSEHTRRIRHHADRRKQHVGILFLYHHQL